MALGVSKRIMLARAALAGGLDNVDISCIFCTKPVDENDPDWPNRYHRECSNQELRKIAAEMVDLTREGHC